MKKQTQTTKEPKKCNVKVSNIIKPILLGPIITILITGILYVAWWGVSKLFYVLHGWMTTSVLPWLQEAWPYVLVIWAFVLITAVAYNMLTSKRKDDELKEEMLNNQFDGMYDLSLHENEEDDLF